MLTIQYYSHLILHSKYSFIIKLAIFLAIYMLFYADNLNDLAYCAKKKGAAKAAEATKAAASAKVSAKTQLVAEAKTNTIKTNSTKYLSMLKEKDAIIQHKEDALQSSYSRFFTERDKVRDLETLVAEMKEGVDLDNFYSLKETNRRLSTEIERLTEELQREKNRVTSLRQQVEELTKTNRFLKDRYNPDDYYERYLR